MPHMKAAPRRRSKKFSLKVQIKNFRWEIYVYLKIFVAARLELESPREFFFNPPSLKKFSSRGLNFFKAIFPFFSSRIKGNKGEKTGFFLEKTLFFRKKPEKTEIFPNNYRSFQKLKIFDFTPIPAWIK